MTELQTKYGPPGGLPPHLQPGADRKEELPIIAKYKCQKILRSITVIVYKTPDGRPTCRLSETERCRFLSVDNTFSFFPICMFGEQKSLSYYNGVKNADYPDIINPNSAMNDKTRNLKPDCEFWEGAE